MQARRIVGIISLIALLSVTSALSASNGDVRTVSPAGALLWRVPDDIPSRDLFRGPGSQTDAPQGPFVFVKEDFEGTNPKFSVRDRNGVEWKVKIGVEAQPEVAASRLVWAMGYFTGDYYFVPKLRVEKMPVLKRGGKLLGPDGAFYGARFKRESGHGKKVDNWKWRKNPFVGTREFNGLRVLMALINNWDLKTVNNSILRPPGSKPSKNTEIYLVSDLGSSFGTSNWVRPLDHAKGNLVFYNQSKFIGKIADEYVDLNIGKRPAIINAVNLPLYLQYLKMGWIGKHIPRADARWMGQMLSRLSRQQIRDAFRAAGYSPFQVEGFTEIVLNRIAELNNL